MGDPKLVEIGVLFVPWVPCIYLKGDPDHFRVDTSMGFIMWRRAIQANEVLS